MPTSETALVRAERVLTPTELEAYQKYLEAGKPPLAASTAGKFFKLYLQGHTCQEIAELNPALGLGIVVRARVDHDWDKQREEHIQGILTNIRQVVQKTQLDAIRFVSEGLAVFQKLAGDKFQKYLQSGDIKDLGDFKDMSFKSYKELLELMLKLTGQNENKKVSGEVVHRHQVVEPTPTVTGLRVDQPMTSFEASSFLERLDPKGKK